MNRTCQFQDEHLGQPPCGERAVFNVLRHEFDPARPDPGRDSAHCCREHLAATVEMIDVTEPGYVVHVEVIASVLARRTAEEVTS